jgi:superfamily II DNA or RNA helicase
VLRASKFFEDQSNLWWRVDAKSSIRIQEAQPRNFFCTISTLQKRKNKPSEISSFSSSNPGSPFAISAFLTMAARRPKTASQSNNEPTLFDPVGVIAFPQRIQVIGSVHSNQIFGLAHTAYSARVQLSPIEVRGISGFLAHQSDAPITFISPRKTAVQASTDSTLVVPDFANGPEIFEATRQSKASWCAPRPINPAKESIADGEARCNAIVSSWAGRISFRQEHPDQGLKGLRRPQIGALYAVLAHWSTTDAAATIVMPTGTGKTETMLALLVCAQLPRVMVVVPNSALRDQIAEKFITLGKLAECECVPKHIRPPVVARLRHRPKSAEEVEAIFRRANVIVSTMQIAGQCVPDVQARMAELCSHLFIDEAHHIAARTWAEFKKKFEKRPILQFTATPFRTDGKRVDGKFIYSYPLSRAQTEGYFKAVSFVAVEEFDPDESDRAVATRAGELLRTDCNNGLDHLLMARVDTTERARKVHALYQMQFPEFKPVEIHTKVPAQDRKERLEALRTRKSRILICVDMFGEGFDFPQLKIAALHDKHKSLAITLQFVGRFTRDFPMNVGDAKVVANIADEAISDALKNLYAEDADWNFLLKMLGEAATGRAHKRNEILSGFTGTLEELPLQVLFPRMSAVVYRTTCDQWTPLKIADVILGTRLHAGPVVNPAANLAIFVTRDDEMVRWGAIKQIQNVEWNLHVLHWNEELKLLFINSSSKDFHERVAQAVGGSDLRVTGKDIFRVMGGIKRLVLTNLGLSHAFGKNIRYTMFMGADIAEGLTESAKQNRRMSNVFGLGYEDDERITIGCSFKGRLWSHRIAYDLSEFIEWCAHVGKKLLDSRISVESVLTNLIKARAVAERPELAPIMAMWPEDFQSEPEERVEIELDGVTAALFECAIDPTNHDTSGPLGVNVSASSRSVTFEVVFSEEKAEFKQISGATAYAVLGGNRRPLVEWFNEDPPIIHFSNGDFLVFNELFELPRAQQRVSFDPRKIITWDWSSTNLRIESQGPVRNTASIQWRVISKVLEGEFGDFDIVFDGDGKGEIADVVAIKRTADKVVACLFHCKYSGASTAGARIDDLYEVCGQAQKCIHWRESPKRMLKHLLHQEDARTRAGSTTRFEKGSRADVQRLVNGIRQLAFEYRVYLVQPGLSKAQLSGAFLDVLGATEIFLQETYSMPLRAITSA